MTVSDAIKHAEADCWVNVAIPCAAAARGRVVQILSDGRIGVSVNGNESSLLVVESDSARPDDAFSASKLAKLLYSSGFPHESLLVVKKACLRYAFDVEALLAMSSCMIRCNDLQEAESILRKAIKLDPCVTSSNHLLALCYLAELKRRHGHIDDAICLCEMVLEHDLDPASDTSTAALVCLCQLYLKIGDNAEAKQIRSRIQHNERLQNAAVERNEASGFDLFDIPPSKRHHARC